MPQLGESIAEATVVRLLVAPGDHVENHQEVLEVETNKATMTVVSPCAGRLAEWRVQVNESYPVGAVLGHIEAEQAITPPTTTAPPQPPAETPPPPPAPASAVSALPVASPPQKVEPRVKGLPVPADRVGATYMSPRLKARIQELGLQAADLAGIAGSGAGGRVTIEDFERYIAHLEQQKLTPASPMRVAVADAMRRSWTRPLATVGLPVLLDPLLQHRKQFDPKPGPTLYALRALALALAENSAPAGRLIGARIVHPPAVDIGFAVEAEEGVLVPVIRAADQKRLVELVPLYERLLRQARARNLPADATGGSICTVTNYGTFGLIWATPIPLPEQTLVLGLGAGRKVPRWDDAKGQFVPVTEAYLTLSFDHRVLDGGAAGRLLTRIAALMNQPDQL
jgi:pyruvate/2-oxoglutarate dehydrogenase complex dihydrolipoamide acyltransferase (E2) component